MKRYWKKEWLAALRSGEYRQGQQVLRQKKRGTYRYCCLGVLADIADPHGWQKNNEHRHRRERLNYTLQKRADLSVADENCLIDMNDSGKRFTTIAKWIEENL
jgi:hypothetical protein